MKQAIFTLFSAQLHSRALKKRPRDGMILLSVRRFSECFFEFASVLVRSYSVPFPEGRGKIGLI